MKTIQEAYKELQTLRKRSAQLKKELHAVIGEEYDILTEIKLAEQGMSDYYETPLS